MERPCEFRSVFKSTERELLPNKMNKPMQSNPSGEEMLELRALAADKTIVIKATGKGSSVIIWDRSGRLLNNFRIKNIVL